MELNTASDLFSILGHSGRLAVFRLLARRFPEGVPATEIAQALGLKPNTLSVYVGSLARAGLIRSERRGRTILYRFDTGRVGALVDYLVADCCRGRPDICAPVLAQASGPGMAGRALNVLFVCTGNAARSIFAETLLRDEGGPRFHAYSAGTEPSEAPKRAVLEVLQQAGHGTEGLCSKPLTVFQSDDAPEMDFVLTVCDRAANAECHPFRGQPMAAHWGIPDPVEHGAFARAYEHLRRRVRQFVALPFEQLDRMSLQSRLDEIGRIQDA